MAPMQQASVEELLEGRSGEKDGRENPLAEEEMLPERPMKLCKAIVLLSGGLDSSLAIKMIVGRDQAENEQIRSLAKPGSCLFRPFGFRGSTALACGIL